MSLEREIDAALENIDRHERKISKNEDLITAMDFVKEEIEAEVRRHMKLEVVNRACIYEKKKILTQLDKEIAISERHIQICSSEIAKSEAKILDVKRQTAAYQDQLELEGIEAQLEDLDEDLREVDFRDSSFLVWLILLPTTNKVRIPLEAKRDELESRRKELAERVSLQLAADQAAESQRRQQKAIVAAIHQPNQHSQLNMKWDLRRQVREIVTTQVRDEIQVEAARRREETRAEEAAERNFRQRQERRLRFPCVREEMLLEIEPK